MFCTETEQAYNLELIANVTIYTIDILSGLLPDKLKLLELQIWAALTCTVLTIRFSKRRKSVLRLQILYALTTL